MENYTFRSVTPEDAEELLNIYRYYIENTAITFEITVPTVEEFRSRIENTLQKYPYIAVVKDGVILGYAYAGPLKTREAYRCSCELSVYLRNDLLHQGLGSALYLELFRRLKKQGITNVYACITYSAYYKNLVPDTSVFFHDFLEFRKVGHFHSCGIKFDREFDVIWMEKFI